MDQPHRATQLDHFGIAYLSYFRISLKGDICQEKLLVYKHGTHTC